MSLIRIAVSLLKLKAANRPAGYIEDVYAAASLVTPTSVYLTRDAYDTLWLKYAPPGTEPPTCTIRNIKLKPRPRHEWPAAIVAAMEKAIEGEQGAGDVLERLGVTLPWYREVLVSAAGGGCTGQRVSYCNQLYPMSLLR